MLQTVKDAIATVLDVVRIVPDSVGKVVRTLDDGLHVAERVIVEVVAGAVRVLSGLIHVAEDVVLTVTDIVSVYLEDAADRLRGF